jgi:hypothetical protein
LARCLLLSLDSAPFTYNYLITNSIFMKNVQKLLCLLALIVGINSLSAQEQTIIFTHKHFFADSHLKIVAPSLKSDFCDARFYFDFLSTGEYTLFNSDICMDTDGIYTIHLETPEKETYVLNFASNTGIIITAPDDIVFNFGLETLLKADDNSISIIMAGKNTYAAFTLPKLEIDLELFNFASENEAEKFYSEFMNLQMDLTTEISFNIEPAINLQDEVAKCKISRNANKKFVFDINYQGKSLSLVMDESK